MFRKTSLAAAIRRTLVLSALTTAASQMAVAQDQTDQADELVGEIVVTGSRGFVRIERSLLVNLRRVAFAERALPGGFVFTMAGGRRLCSSRKYRRTIVKAMRFGGSNSSSDGA